MEQAKQGADMFMHLVTVYGLHIIEALILFFIGRWAIGFVVSLVKRMLERAQCDNTIVSFAAVLVNSGLFVLLTIAILSHLGIQTTSFAAILAAAGLAVGLALQGSLSNFAAGVMMIMFRPLRVGDYVECAGAAGTVKEVGLFATIMHTPDNRTIIIPNAAITAGNITNYSIEEKRRLDIEFGIGYGDDIAKAKDIIWKYVNNEERIMQDDANQVVVCELADSSVNLSVRVWLQGADYFAVKFKLLEDIKLAFDAEGITIPFPQQELHIRSGKLEG